MEDSTSNQNRYFDRYYNRLRKYRRKYFFEKLGELKWSEIQVYLTLLRWIKDDIIFAVRWSLNAALQVRTYGRSVRNEYGLSYWEQWKRYMYVRFVLRKRPKHFRTRMLFNAEKWERVNDYILDHYLVQHELVIKTAANELVTIGNKLEFSNYCKSRDIPTPEVVAVVKDGEIIYQESHEILPESDIFVKSLSGGQGQGVRKFTFLEEGYVDKDKKLYSKELLEDYLKSVSLNESSLILQRVLKNHESWKDFTRGGLATCRIVSARLPENEEIIPLFGCFRMPPAQAEADNYSLGGLISPVDLKTGRLGVAVASKPIYGKYEFTHHPHTNYPIEGQLLSHWQELVEFTLATHKHFKTIFVGWDVTITVNGCCMIEGNIGWASGSYEIPFQDSLKNTIYPELYERWMEKVDFKNYDRSF